MLHHGKFGWHCSIIMTFWDRKKEPTKSTQVYIWHSDVNSNKSWLLSHIACHILDLTDMDHMYCINRAWCISEIIYLCGWSRINIDWVWEILILLIYSLYNWYIVAILIVSTQANQQVTCTPGSGIPLEAVHAVCEECPLKCAFSVSPSLGSTCERRGAGPVVHWVCSFKCGNHIYQS